MGLYILVFIYLLSDFILNHFSMMMETDIQSNIMYFGLLSMISLFLDFYGQHVLKQLSHAKKMEFLKKYIIKYEQMDQQSKEKGDPISFKTLLDQASSVIEMKFNWRINVILSFITTLFSVSYIIITIFFWNFTNTIMNQFNISRIYSTIFYKKVLNIL